MIHTAVSTIQLATDIGADLEPLETSIRKGSYCCTEKNDKLIICNKQIAHIMCFYTNIDFMLHAISNDEPPFK